MNHEGIKGPILKISKISNFLLYQYIKTLIMWNIYLWIEHNHLSKICQIIFLFFIIFVQSHVKVLNPKQFIYRHNIPSKLFKNLFVVYYLCFAVELFNWMLITWQKNRFLCTLRRQRGFVIIHYISTFTENNIWRDASGLRTQIFKSWLEQIV